MLLLSLILLSFQEPIIADEELSAKLEQSDNAFRTITAGNHIDHGPFKMIIPQGSMYVPPENVQAMYRLMGTDSIPGCVGMFISSSNQWDFAVSVQYLDQTVLLRPELPYEAWEELVLTKHILSRDVLNMPGEVHLPPQYDYDEGSFTVGVKYTEPDNRVVSYIRKLWAVPKGGLVLTLMAKNNSDEYDAELISQIFGSVQVLDKTPKQKMSYAVNYLGMLGISKRVDKPPVLLDAQEPVQIPDDGVSLMTILFSVGLVLFAAILLLTASRLKAKQNEGSENTD